MTLRAIAAGTSPSSTFIVRNLLQKSDFKTSCCMSSAKKKFIYTLFWRNLSSKKPLFSSDRLIHPQTQQKITKSVTIHISIHSDPPTSSLNSALMDIEEFKQKYLLTFEQYSAKYAFLIKPPTKEHPEDSTTILTKGYDIYVKQHYSDYITQDEPKCNPLILDAWCVE